MQSKVLHNKIRMKKHHPTYSTSSQNDGKRCLKEKLQNIIATQNLESQRHLVESMAVELGISAQDCSAALVYLYEDNSKNSQSNNTSPPQSQDRKPLTNNVGAGIRLVRYRLDVGHQHKVTQDELKKVLVEESGVDIKNITNLRIQECYTLIDLPDEMPQEIFLHLKTIEINAQKLDIKRVKPRNKKRGNRMQRRSRSIDSLPAKEVN